MTVISADEVLRDTQLRPIMSRRDAQLRNPARPPLARRERLLDALGGPGGRPFAVLVAPAGYGKTTLLREWCARDPRPSAWLTLGRPHDDPLLLLRAIARAADDAFAQARDGRIVLVLDDVQNVLEPGAHETLAGVMRRPPEGMTIALASRTELPLPVARLSAAGLVTELRAPALAMTRAEAAEFVRAAGLRVDAEALDALMRHTEGWPAGLALAAVSLGRSAAEHAFACFDGRDRLVAAYIRDEVLATLDDAEREFVTATAALDAFTAPLCDAVLERTDSARMLDRLQRRGFPFVALDRSGERVRHHHLVRDLLRAELGARGPALEPALHRRASAWHERAGDTEAALRHALAAGDPQRGCATVSAALGQCVERATGEMVEHWLSLFAPGEIARRPPLAVAAAAVQLAGGQGDIAEHWLRAAASGGTPEIVGVGTALRAVLGRQGLTAIAADAARASELLAPDSPGQALCRLASGVAAHLRSERGAARALLEEGARRAAVHAPLIGALCLAQLALLALDEDDREEAAGLTARARAQVERFRLERFPASALVLAVSAFVSALRRVDGAAQDLAAAAALRERLTDFAVWYDAEVEVVLARAALRLTDVNGACRHAVAAGRLVARLPGAVTLAEWQLAAGAELDAYRTAVREERFVLTAAELKVLQFLPTHLTFRQIGERTSVTGNTVKTQANAVYRKIGVRSRSAAVMRARELGLIEA
ncbi:LuxR C-terminal-related transcriptional regulator [Solirubrobacter soli]|uniref:LuxR C-terminal-related transcriptional regulator n=1 Tax=Solirubrobacter soli TaxID=363832 RepID=UPI000420FDDC|nr:LuxR C-terminal-related transcriptional regulator [Solirubrobacter soli]